jgi:hypothetical protein
MTGAEQAIKLLLVEDDEDDYSRARIGPGSKSNGAPTSTPP